MGDNFYKKVRRDVIRAPAAMLLRSIIPDVLLDLPGADAGAVFLPLGLLAVEVLAVDVVPQGPADQGVGLEGGDGLFQAARQVADALFFPKTEILLTSLITFMAKMV